MAASTGAAPSQMPSVVKHAPNSIGANAPIGTSTTSRIYTSLTDVTELTDPALSCERPLWWRPEQRLSELLRRQRPLHSASGNPQQPRVSVVVKSFNHEEYI